MKLPLHILTLLFLMVDVLGRFVVKIAPFEICSDDVGSDGICPNGNTCCRRHDGSWGCIASDMGKETATCCQDDLWTGCPVGYVCRSETHDCKASNDTESFADPLTQVLPRYQLCNADEIITVHGLPVDASLISSDDSTLFAEIPYYSNMGPLEQIPSSVSSSVDMALIVVHGSDRNGDDYFCAAKATVELQDRFSNVLIIALNYYSVSDERPRDTLLFWDNAGTWRSGADSIGPVPYSSFAVLDQVVTTVRQQFSNLQQITVAGHSAGGQLTQRWALLSDVPHTNGPFFQLVVANPSDYAYLSPHRFIRGSWIIPSDATGDGDCPEYDKWKWGLEDGGHSSVPYRDRALAHNVTAVLERYKTRNVYYMVGGIDRCNVSGTQSSGWCHSHGLETTCMDQLQGHNRYERNSRFVASLRRLGYWNENHRRLVVPGVGHDHSMMFESANGIRAIFHGMTEKQNSQTVEHV
jgi:pimeloyl-ACP methyl ester carboxylesterase